MAGSIEPGSEHNGMQDGGRNASSAGMILDGCRSDVQAATVSAAFMRTICDRHVLVTVLGIITGGSTEICSCSGLSGVPNRGTDVAAAGMLLDGCTSAAQKAAVPASRSETTFKHSWIYVSSFGCFDTDLAVFCGFNLARWRSGDNC